jgi:gas vesicle protein
MHMSERNHQALIGALLLIAGGTAGAAAALLFAPQSGRRTRRKISRSLRHVRDQAERSSKDAADRLQDLLENISDQTESLVGRGEAVADELRSKLLHQLERGEKTLARSRRELNKFWE